MAFRLVPRTPSVRTGTDAEAEVVQSTGGAVIPTGETKSCEGGWWVGVYSADGLSERPTAPGRIRLKVLVISDDGKLARVQGANGFEFDVPTSQPICLPSFPGETVKLRAGTTIECSLVPGTHDRLSNVLVEDDLLKERPEFENAPDDSLGWTPEIATGLGFEKQ